jgi:Peptidase C13 family
MKYRVTWFAALLLTLVPAAGDAAASTSGGSWQVVLAAGDDQAAVFDDATRTLARRLQDAGVPVTNIHRLSASPGEIRSGVEPATAANLLRNIAQLPAKPGDRCLIFLTSHGQYDQGLWLARSQRALRPEELAQALSRGCAAVPTVAVVSACYSGGFAAGTMLKPNRIILTASRRDRPSFGCQVERTYSFFDGCFLRALPQASNWKAVFRSTRSCVSGEEKALGEPPSDPQAYFGPAAAGLSARFGAPMAPQRVTTIGATPSRRVTWSATSRS